jgi:hypothetical protein
MKRTALRTADESETWYEPNGMSPTTSGRRTAEATARVMKIISSIVTGTVDSWPSTTIAALSPTSTTSIPAASARRPPAAS